jgi:hypothetical protein
MMEGLQEYYDYIKNNPNSLIMRIYGVFQIQMEGIVPVNMILCSNAVQLVDPKGSVDKIFDLKGSWNNRIVKPGENQTKKDRNFLACKKNRLRKKNNAIKANAPFEEGLVQFAKTDKDAIIEQMRNDVNLL